MIATFVSYPLFGSFQKIVKVQIREDLTQEDLFPRVASSPFGILSRITEPSVSHLVKPVVKPPSTEVKIQNKTMTFPTTEPGETSGIISQDHVIQVSAGILSPGLFS